MYSDPFGDTLFNVVPVLVSIGFVVVIGLILFNAFKGVKQWSINEHSPQLTVAATVKSKYTSVSSHTHHHDNTHHTHSTSTTYYTTFEVESGDRLEFVLSRAQYGELAEGDVGVLQFQGTRYLGFKRNVV